MTDVMPEQTTEDEQGWGEDAQSSATYPEFPENPHNHRYTISFDGRGPMVVVRGNTAQEIADGFTELMNEAVGAVMGNAWAAIKAAAAVASGLGATPVPNGAPPAPQAPGAPTPPPFGPNVSVPGAPGYQGAPVPPPAPPQGGYNNGGGQQRQARDNTPEFQQNGWYALNVPYPKKGSFDAICAQYQMKKGRPTEGGQYSFNGANKTWYVHPQYAGAFGDFSPVPA
jgi:hypothetical protein